MKLKNKRTGEMGDLIIDEALLVVRTGTAWMHYESLAELNSEWEDASEEPKVYWYIMGKGEISFIEDEGTEFDNNHKEIGNYFETKEEAEKAVEKLKAWKRLKGVGFKFTDWYRDVCEVSIQAEIHDEGTMGMINDLDLLFSGEDD